MNQYENVLLVTGGAGFIGSSFLRMFVPKYPEWLFINLDSLTYAGDLKKIEAIEKYSNYLFIKGNICDFALLVKIFEEYIVDTVINFAAESHVDNSIHNPNSFMETNIIGTQTLLEVSKSKWRLNSKDTKNLFIQISTDEVYGSLSKSQTPSLEDDVLLPNSPYSASKAAAELICRSYHITYGLPVIITRSSNNYGPYQNSEKFLPKIIINALQKREIPIYGDGTNIRDWIHVYDNCNAILSILEKGKVGEIYNISDNNQMDNLTLIDFVTQRIKANEINTIFVKDRLGHDFRYAISSKKIKELGWSPTIPFSAGVLECINHYEKLLDNSNST